MSNLPIESDVIIVGAGFAGLNLAHALSKNNIKTIIIDRQTKCPDIFRAEKIEPDQAEIMKEIGTLTFRQPKEHKVGTILTYDGELKTNIDTIEQYGISYADTVNSLRENLPKSIQLINERVIEISSFSNYKSVSCSNNITVNAPLVVLSTGGNNNLLKSLNIQRKYENELRSFSFGFDVSLDRNKIKNGFNYFLPSNSNIDYVTIFPIGERMRVNLFTRFNPKDTKIKEFKVDPILAMTKYFKGIEELTGKIALCSKVQSVPTTFYRLRNFLQSGLVVIGDEFQSVSPATGSGLSKVLVDVKVLSQTYIPRWLKDKTFGKNDIKKFYKDPLKIKADSKSMEYWISYHTKSLNNKVPFINKIKYTMMIKGLL